MEASGRNRLHRQLRLIFEIYSRDLRSDSGGMVSLFFYLHLSIRAHHTCIPAQLSRSRLITLSLFVVVPPANQRCSVTDKTILRVIGKIKDTIMSVNNDWIDRHFAFFKGLDEIKDTECALALKFGSDCYIVCPLNLPCATKY